MDMSLSEPNCEVEKVEVDVRNAFLKSPIHGLRELEVEQNGSSILISGKVNSFYQKQLAQEVVRTINPEVQIVNTIVVD